jgi:hypothetical protein
MSAAGSAKEYPAHSIRAATSTKAVQKGVSIQKVKQHANWSQGSNTFEKYYFKPISQHHDSTKIQNSIFQTENRTTSESEAKATSIVLGTTYNTAVAEAKEEEVVQTRPLVQEMVPLKFLFSYHFISLFSYHLYLSNLIFY